MTGPQARGSAMLQGFKEFINRGNVIDLAVAVVVGAAFSRIIASLTDDIITPVIGWLLGDLDFSNYFVRLGSVPAGYAGDPANYAALKEAGVPMIGYGQFLTAGINFLIVAFMIYLVIRAVRKAIPEKPKVETEPAPEAADIVLLREIRDELRRRG